MDLTVTRLTERLLAAYNALLAVVWITTARGPLVPALAAAHLAAAALPWLFDAAPQRRALLALRDLAPLLFVAAFWTEMDLLHRAQDLRLFDAAVAALDARLFGGHPNLTWMPALPVHWFSELMQAVYFAYYPIVFGVPMALLLAGRGGAARETLLRLTVTSLGCCVVYLVFPVAGAAITLPHYQGPLTEGFFYRLNQAAHRSGDAIGTAFPSSHVAYAVTIALAAARCCPRWVAALLAALAAGTCVAVVYTQHHYAVDAVAGVAIAVALQLGAVPLLRRLTCPPRHGSFPRRRTSHPTPVPDTGGGA